MGSTSTSRDYARSGGQVQRPCIPCGLFEPLGLAFASPMPAGTFGPFVVLFLYTYSCHVRGLLECLGVRKGSLKKAWWDKVVEEECWVRMNE